jgi:hypothetical protein
MKPSNIDFAVVLGSFTLIMLVILWALLQAGVWKSGRWRTKKRALAYRFYRI